MFGEIIGIHWLSRRRPEYQVMSVWGQIVFARLPLKITKKSNNPTLQLDRPTASRPFRIAETPSPFYPPNAPEYANCLPSPVDVLPLETQILARSHPSCESDRKHESIRSSKSRSKKCLRGFDTVDRILEQEALLERLPHRRP
jgi:hypothetical protein